MKKTVSLFLTVLLLMMALAACASDATGSAGSSGTIAPHAEDAEPNDVIKTGEYTQVMTEVMAEIRDIAECEGVSPNEAFGLWKEKLIADAVAQPNTNVPKPTSPMPERKPNDESETANWLADKQNAKLAFLDEMIEAVKTTAEEASFSSDKALVQLENRMNAYETDVAAREQNVAYLNYVFGEVIETPTISEKQNSEESTCAMLVRPITALSEADLPQTLRIHTYAKYCAEGVESSDLVMFGMSDGQLNATILNGEPMMEAYVYFIIK